MGKLTDKRNVLKQIQAVRAIVLEEIRGSSERGRFASALSNEGFAGGYLDALSDVEAALTHGHPQDARRYWCRARAFLEKENA